MGSNLLESIGLGNLDIAYVLIGMIITIVVLAVLVIIQIVQNQKLKERYEKFLQGKSASSLEDQITTICAEHDAFRELAESNQKKIKELFKKQKGCFQKVAVAKYDAFKEHGGKLSYCIVLLDEENTGFIINSVHNAGGCYSYTKRIKGGASEIELSVEEEKALQHAIKNER
ncbi:MAG: DUF4446 family protein [Lachnospiraceae bacterium]|nr:DUF4446 family protein [Lachnospiraceae bacterium]